MFARWMLLGVAAVTTYAGDQAVRVIDTKGLTLGEAKGQVNKPAVIASADELARAIADPAAAGKIKAQIDFAKDKLLYFQWGGSGGDKLSFTTAKGEKAVEVT